MNEETDRLKARSAVLATLKTLCDRREVFISLVPPFELSFDIDREILTKVLKAQRLSEEPFRKESNSIENILLAILRRKEDDFIKSQIEPSNPFKLKVEIEGKDADKKEAKVKETERLREEIEKVREVLWDKHLQDRYDLKLSSKAPSFKSIDWDIKLKTRDARLERIRFPYATCRIVFQREFDDSPFTLLGGKTFDSVQINFSVDEIEHLIRVFTTIKQHLEQIEAETLK